MKRAAVIYIAFFLVVAAGSYAMIGQAQQPTISIDNPDYQLQANETFAENGRQYTVTQVSGTSAAAEWTNQSATYTNTWDNNSTVTLGNDVTYRVLIPNGSDVSSFTLREVQNVSEPTITQNGTTYVVRQDGQNRTLVPVDQVLPEPETRQFNEGQSFQHQGNRTTISNVSAGAATLTWTAPRTNTVEFSEGGAANLNGNQYVAHLATNGQGNSVLQLSADTEGYREQTRAIGEFNERINGLWAVSIISSLAAIFLLILAYLPAKS